MPRRSDVSELLAELGPRGASGSRSPLRVAFQDACHLAHAQGIRTRRAALLGSIPGLELVEPAEQAICCGSAGIYNLVQPEAARELGERKAGNVLATEPDAYASANPGCLVQVSTALRRAGPPAARRCTRSSCSTRRSAGCPVTSSWRTYVCSEVCPLNYTAART